MTIWTAVTMKDIVYDEMAGKGIAYSVLNANQTIVNGTEPRLISTTNTGWMLGTGWILFAFSQVMNFIFEILCRTLDLVLRVVLICN